jgi:predicted HTH transcriptional regulator
MPQTDQGAWPLVARLLREPREAEWLEFKRNTAEPEMIGEYISALANGAALVGARKGYLVWGVDDETHDFIGTTFDPAKERVSNQDLEHWLTTHLRPQVEFSFSVGERDGLRFVVMEVDPAARTSVAFHNHEYIRVASHKKALREHSDHERRLWRALDRAVFEETAATENLEIGDVLGLLDYPSYFTLSKTPLPENRDGIVEALKAAGLISYAAGTGWSISNLGAILFCRDIDQFPALSRKALRVVRYKGSSRVNALRERVGHQGYASGFDEMVRYVMSQVADEEVIVGGIRRTVNGFPEIAVRELIANALIHQDLSLTGTGPMVEVFTDRIEVTNPGSPLVPSDRFIDRPPMSRNEKLARLMRLLSLSEERGTGWDKIESEIERNLLPAPLVQVFDDATRVIVFAGKELTKTDKADRVRAIYLHACLKYVTQEPMTNSTVRQRFGLGDRSLATASKFIREATEAGRIVPYDPTVGTRSLRYVPFWAGRNRDSL